MMHQRPMQTHSAQRQRAMALVLVLWIVAGLSVFAASLAHTMRSEAKVVSIQRQMVQARALGEAAIYQLLQHMAAQPRDFLQRETRTIPVDGGRDIQVLIAPWGGLVNINQAPKELLALVLERAAGLPGHEAEQLAQSIVQTREGDVNNPTQRRRRVLWETPQDLLQVPGMTWSIHERLRDLLVADTSGPGIHPDAAPPELLQWLQASTGAAQYLQQNRFSQRYTLRARVGLAQDAGAGSVDVVRQVHVHGGPARQYLPWTIVGAWQAWRPAGAGLEEEEKNS